MHHEFFHSYNGALVKQCAPTFCPLSRRPIDLYREGERRVWFYNTPKTGNVYYTDMAIRRLWHLNDYQREELANICRERTERGDEAILTTDEFLRLNYPGPHPDDTIFHRQRS